jgi:hypothetical protein
VTEPVVLIETSIETGLLTWKYWSNAYPAHIDW